MCKKIWIKNFKIFTKQIQKLRFLKVKVKMKLIGTLKRQGRMFKQSKQYNLYQILKKYPFKKNNQRIC